MRDTTYYIAVSLDGRIAAPDGDFGAFPESGDHMDVILDEYADTVPAHVQEALGIEADGSKFDTVIMGWNAYTPALDVGIQSPYPHLTQVVASRQHRDVSSDIALSADPIDTIRDLRAQEGTGIWIAGGGILAGSLIAEIDHLILKINPVVLGDGIPLFGRTTYEPHRFQRNRVREFRSGVTIVEYSRDTRRQPADPLLCR